MEFEEFRQKYPSLTRQQIATVAGCSVATVDRWYMDAATKQQPKTDHKLRFDIADWLWTRESLEPKFFTELREIGKTLKK